MKLLLALIPIFLSACTVKQDQEQYNVHVQEIMNANAQDVNACYKEALQKDPDTGEGAIHLFLDQDFTTGKILNIKPIATFEGSSDVLRCIEKEVTTWDFKPTYLRGGIHLGWNFNKSAQR